MARKAKWWEYPIAFFDPDVDIADDGTLVSPDGVPLSSRYVPKQVGISGDSLAVMGMTSRTWEEEVAALDNLLSGSKVWDMLSNTEKADIIAQYGTAYSRDRIIDDIAALDKIEPLTATAPIVSDYVDSSEDIYADVDAQLSGVYDPIFQRMDEEAATMRQDFTDQLKSSADMYNRQASGLLSNQYLANAQTYDALQSDMRRSRQNALEAGASAGIRIAGNINSLLTAQNKQAQTALDTSNALAEMLLQQRNAAAGIRSDYRGYMADANQRRSGLELQRQSDRDTQYNQRYTSQTNDFNRAQADYDSKVTNYENQFNNISAGNKFRDVYQARNRNYT